MKERLDVLLVEKGFFPTREKAKRAIMAGMVIVNERKIEKAGTQIKIDEEPEIRIKGQISPYVSRGGLKLEKAIKEFDLNFEEKLVLDVGSSTGGFTDCSLQNKAKFVYSVDVGTNQLDWKLRSDERVLSLENMHIKNLTLDDLHNNQVDYIVMDVSFISITKILKDLVKFMKPETKIMALIKPQFEVGRENIEKGGIVKNLSKHKLAINNVIKNANENNLFLERLDYSPITGGKGNVEYISLLSLTEPKELIDVDIVVENSKILKK